MSQQEQIKIFQEQKVRSVWDEEKEEWYFSIVDVCSVLTDQPDYDKARKYWNKLKQRLREEGFEPVTNCHQLKLTAKDGKKRLTDVATPQELFRIIQSIPSKKAEPFKQWMAQVAAERLEQMQDPELSSRLYELIRSICVQGKKYHHRYPRFHRYPSRARAIISLKSV